MGLFSKIKKAFKKVTGAVKKVVKKVVKGVKKVVKKISSSKILKALAIAAAVVVTGGAALGAMGATAASGGFTGWMVGASQAVTGGTLFGTSTALARGAGTVAKLAASPFKALGTGIGTVGSKLGVNLAPASTTTAAQTAAAGVNLPSTLPASANVGSGVSNQLMATTTNLPAAGSVSATGIPTVGSAGSGTLASNVTAGMSAAQTATVTANTASALATPVKGASWFAKHPKLTEAGVYVGKQVAGAAISGAVGQYIAGDPEQQGSMSGAAYEGESNLDPLRVYAAQQGINPEDIYKNITYGNVDASSQYSAELFRQETLRVT